MGIYVDPGNDLFNEQECYVHIIAAAVIRRDFLGGLHIAGERSFKEHLNRYHVTFLSLQDFLSRSGRDICEDRKRICSDT